MKRQKVIQKEWYEHKPPIEGNEVVGISTITHIKTLNDLIPVQKAKLSLNCGCGSGGQKDIFGPSIGMDISLENIHLLIRRGGHGVVADMEFLPFRDNTFDLVYGFGILHHLSVIKKGVSEAIRVLKRGGYIGFGGENNGWCPLTYIMAFIYRNWRIEKGFYRMRKRRLGKIFRELGITDFKIFTEGMTIYGLGETVYKLTSLGERFLSRIHFLNTFSGYCYFGGRKS